MGLQTALEEDGAFFARVRIGFRFGPNVGLENYPEHFERPMYVWSQEFIYAILLVHDQFHPLVFANDIAIP
jgi:hypothetical protein